MKFWVEQIENKKKMANAGLTLAKEQKIEKELGVLVLDLFSVRRSLTLYLIN